MSEKIKASEPLGFMRRFLGAVLTSVLVLGAMFGYLALTYDSVTSGQLSVGVSMGLFLLLILGLTFLIPFLALAGRAKIAATPILFVNESVKERKLAITEFQVYWYFGIVGAVLYSVFGRNRFALCEEGVVNNEFGGATLYRWDNIKSFTADSTYHQFILKRSMSRKVTLSTSTKYDDVLRILSQRIPSSAGSLPPPP